MEIPEYYKTPYADLYGLNPVLYCDVEITSIPFSRRVINCFMRNKITHLSDLISSSHSQLASIRGFGSNCFEEIKLFLSQLSSGNIEIESFRSQLSHGNIENVANNDKSISKSKLIREYLTQIMVGDFSFEKSECHNDRDRDLLYRYKESYEILGEELVNDCINSPQKIVPILQMFDDYSYRFVKYDHIRELVQKIDPIRRRKKVYSFISAFSLNEEVRETLKQYCLTPNTSFNDLLLFDKFSGDSSYLLLVRFLKWATFDVHEEIELLFESLFSNDRSKIVIEMRAHQCTLEQIGEKLGVTRERVRQIENKVKRKFAYLYSKIRSISKLSAERNGDTVIPPSVIYEYCPNYGDEFVFLLQSIENANFRYDHLIDAFVIGDDSISARIANYMDGLPELITSAQFDECCQQAEEEQEIPFELFRKVFLYTYQLTGDVYHRCRLSRAKVYLDILEKFYPNGFMAYDPYEIAGFRQHVYEIYGDIGLPANDRALTARLSDICIPCGRGIYRAKKSQYIPKELENRILNYINQSESTVFLSNTIFSIFERELCDAGVTNKYYLHGILHELFGDRFTFRRDYISKDPNITSVYSAIVNFIKKHEYPVSKVDIQKAFPGITEIVISLAVSDPEVLNFFGVYLHASKLKITENEKIFLRKLLSEIISDNDAHHIREVFERISSSGISVLLRNSAMYPFQCYSILEYLFREEFQFSRPYVAKQGAQIDRPGEILHDMIYSSEKILVSDISDFCKENRYQILSILEFIQECFDEFLLIDDNTLFRINSIGVNEDIANEIDAYLSERITETMPISRLDLWHSLPKLNVPWSDWLLYSIIKKWGKKTVVSVSNSQFRLAVPLIATPSCYDPKAFDNITRSTFTKIKIDDLDNIDELLEDIIDEDILGDFV